jgi:hypothetical protein
MIGIVLGEAEWEMCIERSEATEFA